MPGAVTAGSFVINMSANVAGLKTDLADAANSVKTSSQNIVNAWAGVTAETDRASYAGMKLVAGLKDEIATFGMTSQQLTQYRANLSGVGTETQALIARLQGMQDASTAFGEEARKAGGHVDGFSFSTAGAKRELLVLAHELSQGNYSKFSGSMMVLAEQTGAASLLFSAAGLTALGMGAAFVVAAVDIYKMSSAIDDFNKSQLLTNNYAGQTRDSMASMAASMQSSATGGISKATEMLAGLAATGKFTGGELAAVGETALRFSELTGQSSDEVIKKFEGMTSGVANFAEESNKSYHFLTAAQYEEIVVLEKQGKSQLAVMETMRLLNESLGEQKQSVLQMINPWTGWGMIIDAVNSSLRQTIFPTVGEQAKKAAADLMTMQREAKAASESWGAGPAIKADWDAKIAEQKHKLHDLIAESNREEIAAGNKQHLDMSNLAGIAARKEMDQLTQSLRSKAAIRADEAKKIQHDADVVNQNAIDNGDKQVYTQDQINKLIAASNDRNKDEVVKGSDDRAKILEGALLVQKTAFDRETSIYGERDKMLALYHSKFGLSDTDFYDGREAARAEYIDSEASAFVKEAALINGFKPKNAEEIAANKNKYDTLLRQHLEFTDKMRQASVDDAANALADEKKKFDDIAKAVSSAGDAELKRLDESIAKQREHNAEIGKTKEQIELAKKAQEDTGTANLEIEAEAIDALLKDSSLQGILQGQYREIYAERLAYLDRIIEKRKEESSLFDTGASLAAAADAAKKAEKSWDSANKSIGDGLYSAIANGGDSAVKKLIKDMKEWFARLVLNPIISPIAAFGASLINPSAASAQGITGGASGISSMFSAGQSLWNGFSGGMSTTLGSTIATAGSALGLSAVSAFGTGMTMSVTSAAAATGASAVAAGVGVTGTAGTAMGIGASVGAAIPYVAAALAVAYVLKKGFGHGERETQSQGIEGSFGSGGFAGNNFANWKEAGGWFTGDNNGRDTSALDSATQTQFTNGFSAIKSASADFAKSLGLSADSIAGYSKKISLTLTSDAAKNQAAITGVFTGMGEDLAKSLLTGKSADTGIVDSAYYLAQNPDVARNAKYKNDAAGHYRDYGMAEGRRASAQVISGPDYSYVLKQNETYAAALQRLSVSLSAVNGMFGTLNLKLYATSIAGGDMASKLADLFGGLQNMQTISAAYFQSYYSDQEKVSITTRQLAASFNSLGFSMPANNAALRKMIEGLDLTTDSGRTSYAQLMGLSGAFASLTTATDQIAASAQQAADQQKQAADQLSQAWESVTNSIVDEVKRIRGLLGGNSAQSFASAQSQFAITTAQARAGDQDAAKLLPQLSQTMLTLAEANAATSLDLQRMQALTASSLGDTASTIASKNGYQLPSFAVGTDYVPQDMIAQIHQGERITPAAYNRSDSTNADLLQEIRALRSEVAGLRAESKAQQTSIAISADKTAKILTRNDTGSGLYTTTTLPS